MTGSLIHILDYEGFPFRCHPYHSYGHLVSGFKLHFHGNKEGGSGENRKLQQSESKLVENYSFLPKSEKEIVGVQADASMVGVSTPLVFSGMENKKME